MSLKNLFLLSLLALLPQQSFAKGVLFFGDSHIPGPFGKTLDQLLRTDPLRPGLAVETYGACGSVARSFMNPWQTNCGYYFHEQTGDAQIGTAGPAPHIQEVLERMKPELTLIELGSNYAQGYEDAGIVADMKKLVKLVVDSGSKCIWISMPDTRRFRANQPHILELTRQAIGSDCLFIDSTVLTHYPDQGGDGLHYEATPLRPIGQNWGQKVFEQIESILPTP